MMGSSCCVSLSHNVMGQCAASAGRDGNHASAQKELSRAELSLKLSVYFNIFMEKDVLSAACLSSGVQDIRCRFDRQGIWVVWLAATLCQPGSSLI